MADDRDPWECLLYFNFPCGTLAGVEWNWQIGIMRWLYISPEKAYNWKHIK